MKAVILAGGLEQGFPKKPNCAETYGRNRGSR